MTPVVTVSVSLPEPDINEIRRYAGCRDDSADGIIFDCISALGSVSGKVCYGEFPVLRHNGRLDLGFSETSSADLFKALDGCDKALLFAATIGFSADRLIAKYGKVSPAFALVMQAVGSERAEALCERFCAEKNSEYLKKGMRLKPRFSPGYGDLPLKIQQDIIPALNCTKNIGITLSDSLLMMPSKSVTAIAGICPA